MLYFTQKKTLPSLPSQGVVLTMSEVRLKGTDLYLSKLNIEKPRE